MAVLNADDEHVRGFAKLPSRPHRAFRIRRRRGGTRGRCEPDSGGAQLSCLGVEFESPLAGRHGVSNVLAGIAVAHAMGIRARKVAATQCDRSPPERCAANAASATASRLSTIVTTQIPKPCAPCWSCFGTLRATRRIAVLGEMLELGREAGTLHRGIGRFAAEQGIHAVIGIRGAARLMVDEAMAAGLSGSAASFFETPEAGGRISENFLKPGDAVLFKGSRGVHVETCSGMRHSRRPKRGNRSDDALLASVRKTPYDWSRPSACSNT